MFSVLILVVAVTYSVHGQAPRSYNDLYDGPPKPFSFSYNAPLDDGVGHSARTESGDGTGRVQGSYTVHNDEGHYRMVEYVADEDGFRAVVRTNEPGTANLSPADVTVHSEAGPHQYDQGLRRPVLNAASLPAAVAPVQPLVPPSILHRPSPNYATRNYAARNYAINAPGVAAPVPLITPEHGTLHPLNYATRNYATGNYATRNYAYRPTNRFNYNAV